MHLSKEPNLLTHLSKRVYQVCLAHIIRIPIEDDVPSMDQSLQARTYALLIEDEGCQLGGCRLALDDRWDAFAADCLYDDFVTWVWLEGSFFFVFFDGGGREGGDGGRSS